MQSLTQNLHPLYIVLKEKSRKENNTIVITMMWFLSAFEMTILDGKNTRQKFVKRNKKPQALSLRPKEKSHKLANTWVITMIRFLTAFEMINKLTKPMPTSYSKSLFKKVKVGFISLIKANFLSRRHFFISFSLAIAIWIQVYFS